MKYIVLISKIHSHTQHTCKITLAMTFCNNKLAIGQISNILYIIIYNYAVETCNLVMQWVHTAFLYIKVEIYPVL